MTAFASVADYTARYGAPSDPDRCRVLLDDAGAFLEGELLRSGIEVDEDDELQGSNLKRISCRLVHDMAGSADVLGGGSQSSVTVGPFSNSWSFYNPTGAFKLLPSERKSLGIGGMRVGSVEPKVGEWR